MHLYNIEQHETRSQRRSMKRAAEGEALNPNTEYRILITEY